jgi:AcrR family transcriptional regulator
MTSTRHRSGRLQSDPGDDPYLDAAREAILAVGVRRTTLTDVARRAGVSRMTLYRRWPDMQALIADLMTREWLTTATGAVAAREFRGSAAQRLAGTVVATVAALRGNPLFQKILEVDPELLLPYLLDRRGRTQDAILDLTIELLADGQLDGSVRDVDAGVLARVVLLAAQGFALSAAIMGDGASPDELGDELTLLLERYLSP